MYEYRCKVVKIIDGDTVDVDIDLGFDNSRKIIPIIGNKININLIAIVVRNKFKKLSPIPIWLKIWSTLNALIKENLSFEALRAPITKGNIKINHANFLLSCKFGELIKKFISDL